MKRIFIQQRMFCSSSLSLSFPRLPLIFRLTITTSLLLSSGQCYLQAGRRQAADSESFRLKRHRQFILHQLEGPEHRPLAEGNSGRRRGDAEDSHTDRSRVRQRCFSEGNNQTSFLHFFRDSRSICCCTVVLAYYLKGMNISGYIRTIIRMDSITRQ